VPLDDIDLTDLDRFAHRFPHDAFTRLRRESGTLARLELRVVFDVLLDRVESAHIAGRVEWGQSNKHTGVRHLPVTLVPRTRLSDS
jgi:cytochrome P450